MNTEKLKRSQIKRITREALVLRTLRRVRRISMRKAGLLIGVSSAAISHYEQGRMDLPKARIPQLLLGYGFTQAEYEEFVAGKALPVIDLRDECEQIVTRIEQPKLKALHAVLLSFLP